MAFRNNFLSDKKNRDGPKKNCFNKTKALIIQKIEKYNF